MTRFDCVVCDAKMNMEERPVYFSFEYGEQRFICKACFDKEYEQKSVKERKEGLLPFPIFMAEPPKGYYKTFKE